MSARRARYFNHFRTRTNAVILMDVGQRQRVKWNGSVEHYEPINCTPNSSRLSHGSQTLYIVKNKPSLIIFEVFNWNNNFNSHSVFWTSLIEIHRWRSKRNKTDIDNKIDSERVKYRSEKVRKQTRIFFYMRTRKQCIC